MPRGWMRTLLSTGVVFFLPVAAKAQMPVSETQAGGVVGSGDKTSAQSTGASPGEATQSSVPVKGAAGGSQSPDPAQLGEIVVTAERRVSTVQNTPISIAVVSGDTLKKIGIVDLATAVEEVPAVQVQRSNTGASFFIRGIGSRGIGGSSPISVYQDGIYQQQPDVISAAFADLDRIEVLRGPQGTLYGRNANGGTVNVITHDPVLGQYAADITLGAGNYSQLQAQTAVNIPVGDTLAVRLVGDVERHDGHLTNGQDDRNDKVVRAKVLWKPTDRLKVLLSAEELFTDSIGPGDVLLSDDVKNPRYAAPYTTFNVVFTGDPVYCSPSCQNYYRVRNKEYRGEVDYDLDFATLTGLVGVQRYRHDLLQAFAGGIEYAYQPLNQESYEVRLASRASSPVQWVVGGYALNQNYSGDLQYVYQIDAATVNAIDKIRSRAAFGQVTVPITERLHLTGGIRYTDDHLDQRVDTGTVDGTTGKLVSLTQGTLFVGSYSKVTFKAGVEYELAPRSLLYAQYSTGFRSGGVDPAGGIYGPETIRAIEIGSKNRFFDNKLQVNVAAYYYRYGNYQLNYILSVGGASTDIETTANVPGQSQLWGGEIEAEYRLTRNDRLDLSANYQGSKFADVTLPTSQNRDGSFTYTDFSGRRFPRTPKWTATAGYEHSFELANGGSIVPHVDGQYKSSYQADIISFTYSKQSQYGLLNGRISYNLPGGKVSLTAYINNATNKVVVEQANTAGPTDRYGILNAPRTYGLVLSAHL